MRKRKKTRKFCIQLLLLLLLFLVLASNLQLVALKKVFATETKRLALFQVVEAKSRLERSQQQQQEQQDLLLKLPSANELQKSSASSNVASRRLPRFATPIGNVTAVLGRDARLVCEVDDLADFQVAWLKVEQNTIISIDTNIIITNYRMFLIPDEAERKWVLHIKNVQLADKGLYACQVNTQPTMSMVGHLEVVVPPKLVEAQTSQALEVGERANATLQCRADGSPKPTVSWRRDDGSPIRLIGNSATNEPMNIAATTTTTMTVKSNTKSNTNTNDADSQTLNAAAAAVAATRLLVEEVSGERLLLANVERAMSGVYICTASNGISPVASKQIPLYVKFAPKVVVENKFVAVSLNDSLVVDCFVEAFPRANSYWSKWPSSSNTDVLLDTRNIADDNKTDDDDDDDDNSDNHFVTAGDMLTKVVKVSSSSSSSSRNRKRQQLPTMSVKQTALNAYTYKLTLSIAKVTRADLGRYACVAANSLGSNDASVEIVNAERQQLTSSLPSSSSSTSSMQSNEGELGSAANSPLSTKPAATRVKQAKRVYDKNYLQAIRSRQSLLDSSASHSMSSSSSIYKQFDEHSLAAIAKSGSTQISLFNVKTIIAKFSLLFIAMLIVVTN